MRTDPTTATNCNVPLRAFGVRTRVVKLWIHSPKLHVIG